MPLADHALVVGISHYPGITNLQGPENDANEFFEWVTSSGGVHPDNAVLIKSPIGQATNDPAKAHPVFQDIQDYLDKVDRISEANNAAGEGLRAGRRLWMFFSGHGFAPSLEQSGVLMANATKKSVYNVGALLFADRLYEGGWFDEVLLFQDACRSPITAANLFGPALAGRNASSQQVRRRFYAFSAKNNKLSKEQIFPDGKVRGVFTATLLEGLRSRAKDKSSGAITARSLKTYLQDNMKSLLSDADKANPEIAVEPDVRDYDPFDIVPAAALAAMPVDEYLVRITLPAAGLSVTIQDGGLQPIKTVDPADQILSIELTRGLYRVVVAGGPETMFLVAGPGSGAGGAIDVRV